MDKLILEKFDLFVRLGKHSLGLLRLREGSIPKQFKNHLGSRGELNFK